jgi:hypothetical protein
MRDLTLSFDGLGQLMRLKTGVQPVTREERMSVIIGIAATLHHGDHGRGTASWDEVLKLCLTHSDFAWWADPQWRDSGYEEAAATLRLMFGLPAPVGERRPIAWGDTMDVEAYSASQAAGDRLEEALHMAVGL